MAQRTLTIQISPEERDTILAALRLWQDDITGTSNDGAMLEDIATNGGEHEALGEEAIDALCERINCG